MGDTMQQGSGEKRTTRLPNRCYVKVHLTTWLIYPEIYTWNGWDKDKEYRYSHFQVRFLCFELFLTDRREGFE